ncbi:MAG: hypothetical protein HKO89_03880 [Saprospiraceae bacterium]|nr:hypothetical protein [Saprospiraceae bacterium]
MRIVTSFFLILFFTVYGCTPKVVPLAEPTPVIESKEEIKEDNNPCMTLDELSPAKKDETETAYVLYKDLVKLKKYNEAFPLWKKAYYGAPAANGSIKYQYEDGLAIYKYFYDNTSDQKLKSSYIDTIMSIYDKRVECFGDSAYVAGRKAFDYYYYYKGEATDDEIYNLFKQSIDAKGKKADYFIINPFSKLMSDRIVNEEISIEEGSRYAGLLLEAIEYGTNSGKNEEAWEIINDYAPARFENLEGIEGIYDCNYYQEKYLELFREDSTNCEIINKAYSRMLWGKCGKDIPALVEVAAAKERHCYTPPPPDGPLKKAYIAYTEGRYLEAVQLFEDFVQLTEDPVKKAKYNLLIGKIYYGDIKNFSLSRKYALESAKYAPESGEPYLLIGKLYASSGPLCGPGRGWDSQIVTWPAIDMWEKAKKDPLVADEANKLIRTYWKYMPKKEDIFQRTIKAGSVFKVGCWINRNTTVRTAD